MNEPQVTSHDDQFDEDDLVAYLDGELDATTAHQLELRLASDPDYRKQLRELQASWDLLEELPRPEVDQAFTQSTVSMIALRAADESPRGRRELRNVATWMFGLAGAALAGAAGYMTVLTLHSAPDRQLIRDLPVIERMDMYQAAESTAFLRQMIREGLFEEENSNGP